MLEACTELLGKDLLEGHDHSTEDLYWKLFQFFKSAGEERENVLAGNLRYEGSPTECALPSTKASALKGDRKLSNVVLGQNKAASITNP